MFELLVEKWKDYKIISLGVVIITVIGLGFSFLQGEPESEQNQFPEVEVLAKETNEQGTSDKEETDTVPTSTIMVDIKGAVHKEGGYEMSNDARVNDLIALAGGLLPDADPKSVNLAQKLTDEAVIYVARQGEEVSVISTSNASAANEVGQSGSKININKASLADLQTITGIGAKRAQDIITFREERGGFSQLEDLKQVSGIGDKTFEKIRGEITLD